VSNRWKSRDEKGEWREKVVLESEKERKLTLTQVKNSEYERRSKSEMERKK